ncbi:MAG TPA: acyltransferase family protein, partial [Pseudosphingobacterium sp.]|nr:acyltransferase family protein [Pseudosphingobacterium sp.]
MSKEKMVRLSWVDAARGLAAFGVAVMHMVERMRSDYPLEFSIREGGLLGNMILDFFNLGKIGVVVFFFISGYVIPFSLAKRSLKEFVISRFFRLYPAYWISIILAIVIIGGYSLSSILINVTMFQRFFGVPDMVGVYWTLQIELIFYFLCVILFCFDRLFDAKSLKNGFYLFMMVSIVLAIARFITDIKLPVALPLSLSVMFLGMVLRNAEESGRQINFIKYFGIFVLSLLLVCLF